MSPEKNTAQTPVGQFPNIIDEAVSVARTAKKNRASLKGLNFYADKLARLRTDAALTFKRLGEPSVGVISAVAELMESTFSAETDLRTRVQDARELSHEIQTRKWKTPPIENGSDALFPLSLLAKTRRGYLMAIGRQMNGCFESGCYDACAVMMRRLLETVIIEAYEGKHIDNKIKTSKGEFLQLTDLISAALSETTWNQQETQGKPSRVYETWDINQPTLVASQRKSLTSKESRATVD